ncbi:MAG: nuclear transport factor 2 family protein [Bacteroidetes bacterium]|nr:nuclear transport factor 2 family protein [Bacteroidota bacterium]
MFIHSMFKSSLLVILVILFNDCLGQDIKTLTDMEKQRIEAIEARAFDFVAGLYDENYHGVTGSGKLVNKNELMEMIRSNNPHIHFSTEDVKVDIYDRIALIRGRQLSKSKMGSVIGQLRYMLVLAKHDDRWQIIESQETIIVE